MTTPRTYDVTDTFGTVHRIECDFIFDNNGVLVFRQGERGSSELVATFAAGQWSGCVKVRPEPAAHPAEQKKDSWP